MEVRLPERLKAKKYETAVVDAQVRFQRGEPISDQTAVSIAAGWMSPGYDGVHLTALVTTGKADASGLQDNIYAAKHEAERGLDRTALNMLAVWVNDNKQ